MLYHQYRPRTIAEIDTATVRDSITKLLSVETVPHAYLFRGQKGTGKTSVARIYAKALCCTGRKRTKNNLEPCNTCQNCLSIDHSNSPDVRELDSASNRGINEMKELIQSSSLSPMQSAYRIFILDEAHMITNDGFNVLLKTLEEPPHHTIFIFATTNPEKVPATIISRCYQLNFGRAKDEDIFHMLKRIQKGEKLEISDELISFIVRHADRSFRDGTKLLEELIIQKKLTIPEAKQYLGMRARTSLLSVLSSQTLKDSLLWVQEFSESGGNVKLLIESLLFDLHQQLMKLSGILEDGEELYSFSTQEISQLMKLFSEAYSQLSISPIDTIPLEIALVEFFQLSKKRV